ncbi:MAG: TonB-dependent receptor [Gemmatimonadota bacterium]|nr:TonB-dependent receptor [Gemmatimonadota bacterium]
MRRLLRPLAALVVALATAAIARPVVAQQVDVIRGRVVGPDSLPLESVAVTATSISGNVNRTAHTDKNGRYTITFPGGEGDYLVGFAIIGYAPKRFEVKRTADQEILVADATMLRTGTRLDAVTVIAAREKPKRNDANPDISGTERTANPAALPPDDMGNLAAMAASIPGVTLVPGAEGDPSGFSVLGLTPDQNATTLNGMNFGQSNIPRDAGVSTSLVTNPYDVSRGGFSGAQFNIRTQPGSNFISRWMSLNVDAPQMQWTDAAARALGQQYRNLSLGGRVSGPISYDKAFYNFSYQLGQRSNDLRTLLNTDPLGLRTSGIASDSVSHLLGILHAQSVPSTIGPLPSQRIANSGQLFGTIDVAPPSSTTGQTFNLTMSGNWGKQTPASALTTELPAHSGDRVNWQGFLQGRHSSYFGFGVLSETQAGYAASRNYGLPYLSLPSGSVRVNSTFDDGTDGVKTVAFGGSASLGTSQTSQSVDAANQLSWFSANNKHKVKFTTEIRRDAYSQDQTTNRLGSFSYNSLQALQDNTPASFVRQLQPRTRSGSELIGGASLGDSWRFSDALQFQYGVRVDGSRFSTTPTQNPDVQTVFGVNNNYVPNNAYFSPRLGFSWGYGTAAQVAGFEGAVRGPRAVVRGGAGIFQNVPGATLIGAAIDNTGLPGSLQQLFCVGPATPTPNWAGYATDPSLIPTTCADGSTGTVFANSAPNVSLFSRGFASPRSLRSNLQWSGAVLNNLLNATFEGIYSLNEHQPSSVDLNFNPVTRFSLADEGNRPVFVQPTSIVPTTGSIGSGDARVTPLFSHVNELRSDMRSESRQLSARISPLSFNTKYSWSLAYVYSNFRERTRGFNSTVGNPLDVEWARSPFDSRHQITYNLAYNFFDWVRVSWFGSFRSGTPFTPLIAGDVNGDGFSNDRAFIFNPSTTTDAALATSMQSLLDKSSSEVRSCLSKQLGTLAGRNSCEGPWTSTASLSFSFNPLKVRMPQRATLSFAVSNPLGAADLLVHGENHLRGWGQTAFPDQSLLFVRGFDPSTNRYKYEVNQRFGSTLPAFSAIRAPVTLTAMMRIDIGPSRERQLLTQQLDRGRKTEGQKTGEQILKLIYGSGSLPNAMAGILRQSDSLKLTGKQADSLATMNRWYLIRLDSIWTPVAKHLAALPDHYDQSEAYNLYKHAREGSVDLLIKLAPSVRDLLSAEQRRKLPDFLLGYLDVRYLASIRSGTSGNQGMFPGAGPGAPGAGGGASVSIIR